MGSEMCIRDRSQTARVTIHSARPGVVIGKKGEDVERLRNEVAQILGCLLYTSDAADDLLCVDLGGRRIIKKKNNINKNPSSDS